MSTLTFQHIREAYDRLKPPEITHHLVIGYASLPAINEQLIEQGIPELDPDWDTQFGPYAVKFSEGIEGIYSVPIIPSDTFRVMGQKDRSPDRLH